MKISSRFPQIANLIIAAVASVIIFLLAHNYSLQFFISYLFFLVGGLCAFLATKNWSSNHRNNFPIKTVFIIVAYLYWLLTVAIVFEIGIIGNLHWKLFLLIELVSMGIVAFIIFLFQSVSEKFKAEDENMRIRDAENSEITQRLSVIYEKSARLNTPLNYEIQKKIITLKEAFTYSEVLSPHYTTEMIQSIYNGLTVIENELNAVLNIQAVEMTGLESAISYLMTIIENNDKVCKASKR